MLTGWLEDAIASQLLLANGWLADRVQARQLGIRPEPAKRWEGLYQDNGSALDIIDEIHREHNSSLQIIHEHPLILTDGATFIEAQLARHSPQAVLNAVLAVHKYTIRFTSYGPPRDQLRFLLDIVDYKGATGPIPFKPTPLCKREQIISLVQSLRQTRAQDDHRRFCVEDDATDHMAPHPNSNDDGFIGTGSPSQNDFGTQLAFETQLKPTRHVPDDTDKAAQRVPGDLLGGQVLKEQRVASVFDHANLLNLLVQGPPNAMLAVQTPSSGGFARANINTPAIEPANMPPPRVRPRLVQTSNDTDSTLLETQAKGPELTISQPPIRSTQVPAANEFGGVECKWMDDFDFASTTFRVSEKQVSLLRRDESWLRPLFNRTFPEGNIPINLLERVKERCQAKDGADGGSNSDVDAMSTQTSDEGDHEQENGPVQKDVPMQEDVVEEGESGSQVSWPPTSSPIPEPPRRPYMDQGLPPDSSAGELHANDPIQKNHQSQALHVESSNSAGKVASDPPSSPPVDVMNFDSGGAVLDGDMSEDEDDEMELCVPGVLGQDKMGMPNPQDTSQDIEGKAEATGPTILVKETPYKGDKPVYSAQMADHSSSTQNQASSGASKTSIVYSTCIEDTSNKGKSGDVLPGEKVKAMHLVHSQLRSYKDGRETVAQNPVPSTAKDDDTPMVDAPLHFPLAYTQSPSQYEIQSAVSPVQRDDGEIQLAKLHPDPVSIDTHAGAAMSTVDMCPKPLSTATKRKLNHSPSKYKRHSKRRELKIPVDWDDKPLGNPGNRDLIIQLERRESRQKFAHQQRSATPHKTDAMAGSEHEPMANAPWSERVAEGKCKATDSAEDQISSGVVKSARQVGIKEIRPVTPQRVHRDYETVDESGAKVHEASAVPPSHLTSSQENLSNVPKARRPQDFGRPTVQSPEHVRDLETVFQRFKAAYPKYTGNAIHFFGMCKQILELDLQDRMVPGWQWDDFIIRNRTSYKEYVDECWNTGELVEPYHRFYKDQVRGPFYEKGVVTDRVALETILDELADAVPSRLQGSSRPPAPGSTLVVRTAPQINDSPHASKVANRPGHPPFSTPKTTLSSRFVQSRSSKSAVPARPSLSTARSGDKPRNPREAAGNAFRDFAFAHQRITSWTGSTEVDPTNSKWPNNVAIRQPVQAPRERVVDVVDWGDVL